MSDTAAEQVAAVEALLICELGWLCGECEWRIGEGLGIDPDCPSCARSVASAATVIASFVAEQVAQAKAEALEDAATEAERILSQHQAVSIGRGHNLAKQAAHARRVEDLTEVSQWLRNWASHFRDAKPDGATS